MYAAHHTPTAALASRRTSRSSRAPGDNPARGRGGDSSGAAPASLDQAPSAVGKVHLVGAGPGDPELLTLRAARLIANAKAVVYDHLVGDAIVDLIPPKARRVYAGKEAGNHALPQHAINQLLVDLAREGLDVVRLKGGDPFIFGRGGEEMQAVQAAGIRCEIVPGITAAAGAASCTGIPLTHREHAQTLVFATGHLKDGTVDLDWPALARPRQTLVIYMGLGALEAICTQLIAHGLPATTPAAVIHAATTPAQCGVHSTLADLPNDVRERGIRAPALIMVGEVISIDPGMLLTQTLATTA
ncbi:uroporphyrinogen-III C-methyltransferase [Thauera mechernichensis]|uniref:uroporphyrinogen-III C-methyltransferase n=1 Tax=Thauera mechernichensis TaxID=82788 RepID=A0ABW3WF61_9RHOO|nr:uroporphyrinogen-III C-methyltransferase [Thauera mechernichensis]MDG3064717.1 uroporphyrinogen-III C-methyltransferase [Thauera mechernichensis]